jgi:hypothetical protein
MLLDNIKSYKEHELKQYVIANALVFLLAHKFIDFSDTANIELIQAILSIVGTSLLASVIYIFTILIDGIISDEMKVKLLNLFFLSLPGERIFTEIRRKNKDSRFTTTEVMEKYSDIYANFPSEKSSKQYENSKWYAIYSKYRNESMIFYSNREYLLLRDMYVSTMVIIAIYGVVNLFLQGSIFSATYMLYLVGLLIVTNISTHIKAKRFVYNVIALDIHK